MHQKMKIKCSFMRMRWFHLRFKFNIIGLDVYSIYIFIGYNIYHESIPLLLQPSVQHLHSEETSPGEHPL